MANSIRKVQKEPIKERVNGLKSAGVIINCNYE